MTLRQAAEALVNEYTSRGGTYVTIRGDLYDALRLALAQPEERGAEWRAGWRAGVEAAACWIEEEQPEQMCDLEAFHVAEGLRALSPPEETP